MTKATERPNLTERPSAADGLAYHEPIENNAIPPSPHPGDEAGRLREFCDWLNSSSDASNPYGEGREFWRGLAADIPVTLARLETAERENKRLADELELVRTRLAFESGLFSTSKRLSAEMVEAAQARCATLTRERDEQAQRLAIVNEQFATLAMDRDRLSALIRDDALPALATARSESKNQRHHWARRIHASAAQAHAQLSEGAGE